MIPQEMKEKVIARMVWFFKEAAENRRKGMATEAFRAEDELVGYIVGVSDIYPWEEVSLLKAEAYAIFNNSVR